MRLTIEMPDANYKEWRIEMKETIEWFMKEAKATKIDIEVPMSDDDEDELRKVQESEDCEFIVCGRNYDEWESEKQEEEDRAFDSWLRKVNAGASYHKMMEL